MPNDSTWNAKRVSPSRRKSLRLPFESALPRVKIVGVEAWILKCGSLFVIVRTDQGITGYGESSPMDVLNRVIDPPLEQKGGYLPVPEGPGLGIQVDEGELRKLRMT